MISSLLAAVDNSCLELGTKMSFLQYSTPRQSLDFKGEAIPFRWRLFDTGIRQSTRIGVPIRFGMGQVLPLKHLEGATEAFEMDSDFLA